MRRKWEQEKFAERSGCQPHTGTGKAGGAIVRIVVDAVTGTFAVMLLWLVLQFSGLGNV